MAKEAVRVSRTTKGGRRAALSEYSRGSLRHDVQAGDTTFTTGTQGVIVHRHADGVGFEVEFEHPAFRVITLTERDLRPVDG